MYLGTKLIQKGQKGLSPIESNRIRKAKHALTNVTFFNDTLESYLTNQLSSLQTQSLRHFVSLLFAQISNFIFSLQCFCFVARTQLTDRLRAEWTSRRIGAAGISNAQFVIIIRTMICFGMKFRRILRSPAF